MLRGSTPDHLRTLALTRLGFLVTVCKFCRWKWLGKCTPLWQACQLGFRSAEPCKGGQWAKTAVQPSHQGSRHKVYQTKASKPLIVTTRTWLVQDFCFVSVFL